MNPREWALVAFTLLMESSVGVLLVVVALQAFASRAGTTHGSARAFDLALLAATGTALLALAASLLHLGQPLQAWLALSNVRTSWLSREVLLAASFTAACGLLTVISRGGHLSPWVREGMRLLTALLGVAVVFAMSRLYMVPSQPVWNRLVTPVAFFATTLLVGAVVVAATLTFRDAGAGVAEGATETFALSAHSLVVLAIALLVVQIVLVPANVTALPREPAAAISAASVGHVALWLTAGRVLAALAALVLLITAERATAAGLAPAASAITALALVLVSEILGRVLFYASSVRLGPV